MNLIPFWYIHITANIQCVLPDSGITTRSEEREVLVVGSIPVATIPSCQDMKMLHHNCVDINIVG